MYPPELVHDTKPPEALPSFSDPDPQYDFYPPAEKLSRTLEDFQEGWIGIDGVEQNYLYWVQEDTWLVIKKTQVTPGIGHSTDSGDWTTEENYFAVKASKRGNNVYRHRVKDRFDNLEEIVEPVQFFDPDNKRGIKSTKMIMITLTYDREEKTLSQAWEEVGQDFNRFLASLRQYLDCSVTQMRVWEAHQDAYPHIHVLLSLDREIQVKWHKDQWRLTSYDQKEEIADLWGHGYIDIFGVYDSIKGIHYLGKYLTKYLNGVEEGGNHLTTLAMTWLFRKRAFSISKEFQQRLKELAPDLNRPSITQMNLLLQSCDLIVYELIGLINIESTDGKDPPNRLDLQGEDLEEVLRVLEP